MALEDGTDVPKRRYSSANIRRVTFQKSNGLIPEDLNLQQHRCEDLKSRTILKLRNKTPSFRALRSLVAVSSLLHPSSLLPF